MLEVGSGAGRMAVALTTYLNAEGRYENLDAIPHAVAWCGDHTSAQLENFRFQVADIHSSKNHPIDRFAVS